MTFLEVLAAGGLGGLLSSAVAHVVTTLAHRSAGSEAWLQGRYGPPFFDISLFMGLFYCGIAWALSRRRNVALMGALGPFLGIALPLAVLERMRDLPWQHVVVAVFVLATWGTIFAIGWRLGGGFKGGAGAVAGSFAGYLLLTGLVALAPGLVAWPWRVQSYLPQPTVLLDGLLTGAGLGLGLYAVRRNHERHDA